ncbi:hypothetical protein [Caudoviricetes sp.]|nr:hypothetical protein [Caudoviricetes sp.]
MEPILTSKVLLIAWMLDIKTLQVHYFMPMLIKNNETECRQTLGEIQELHKRGYSFNIVIKGACIPAG